MRLTIAQAIIAREELLRVLQEASDGLSTEQLQSCSKRIRRTLSAKQVSRLLRESGQAKKEHLGGSGARTFVWVFDSSLPPNANEIISNQLLQIVASKLEDSDAMARACQAVLARLNVWRQKGLTVVVGAA